MTHTTYTKTVNFAAKDDLESGDSQKIIVGAEINTEYANIETAVNSKANLASPTFTGTVTFDVGDFTTLKVGTVAITATPAELNILDGVTSTAAELNILDGVTATTAELNILDGVTSTAAELNKLDGVTSTTAELNILDGVTSTAAELNILDGVTSTATELNYSDGVTSAIQDQLDALSGGAATTLDALTDTDITGPASDDLLQWNGSDWVDKTLAEAGIAAATHNHDSDYEAIDAAIVKSDEAETITADWAFDGSITLNAEVVESTVTTTQSTSTLTLDPADGVVQEVTLSQNVTTVNLNLADGEYVTLLVMDGSDYTISWPAGVEWIGGAVPTLDATNVNVIELWMIGTTKYGAFVGVAASA